MAIDSFPGQPYFDDYSEDKKFLRILFNPGRAIQARELTQLQTMLQAQIARHGSHFFKEGSIVIPGDTFLDLNYTYLTLQDDYSGNPVVASSFEGKTIVGKTSGALARVVRAEAVTDTDPNTLFIKFLAGGSTATFTATRTNGSAILTALNVTPKDFFQLGNIVTGTGIPAGTYVIGLTDSTVILSANASASGTSTLSRVSAAVFEPNEDIVTVIESGQPGTPALANVINYSAGSFNLSDPYTYPHQGQGSAFTINRGVIFTNGFFVLVDTQTVVLDKYSANPSYRVGLKVISSVVDAVDDSTLNDPASGFTNFNAPGADRFKIELVLEKRTKTEDVGPDFIELISTKNGIIESIVENTAYAEFEKTLARRTFDESGNYTVRPFSIAVKEHLDNGVNGGFLSSTEGGQESKLAVAIEPGKAYVKGYEIETVSTVWAQIDKPRTVSTKTNVPVFANLGLAIEVTAPYGLFDFTSLKQIEIRDVAFTRNTAGALVTSTPGSIIGYARVRHAELISGSPGDLTSRFRLYLFDVSMKSGRTIVDNSTIAESDLIAGDLKIESIGSGNYKILRWDGSMWIQVATGVSGIQNSLLNATVGVSTTLAGALVSNANTSFGTDLSSAKFIASHINRTLVANTSYAPLPVSVSQDNAGETSQSGPRSSAIQVRVDDALDRIYFRHVGSDGHKGDSTSVIEIKVPGATLAHTDVVATTTDLAAVKTRRANYIWNSGLIQGSAPANTPQHFTSGTYTLPAGATVTPQGLGTDAGEGNRKYWEFKLDYNNVSGSPQTLLIRPDTAAANYGDYPAAGLGIAHTFGTFLKRVATTGTALTTAASRLRRLDGSNAILGSYDETQTTVSGTIAYSKVTAARADGSFVKFVPEIAFTIPTGANGSSTFRIYVPQFEVWPDITGEIMGTAIGVTYGDNPHAFNVAGDLTKIPSAAFQVGPTGVTYRRTIRDNTADEFYIQFGSLPSTTTVIVKAQTLSTDVNSRPLFTVGATDIPTYDGRPSAVGFSFETSGNNIVAAHANVPLNKTAPASEFTSMAKSVREVGTPFAAANIVTEFDVATILKASTSAPIFRLPYSNTKRLTNAAGVKDTTYKVRRFHQSVMSGATTSVSTNSGELFLPYNQNTWQVAIVSPSGTATSNGFKAGDVINMSVGSNGISLGGSPVGSQATITAPLISGSTIAIHSTVLKSEAPATTERTKTAVSHTANYAPANAIPLSHPDVFELVSVILGGNNITDRFILDTGQRDHYYTTGRLLLKAGQAVPVGTLSVTYKYFSHSAGDYFSADSYTNAVAYGKIPTFVSPTTGEAFPLKDCLDFRPVLNSDGTGFAAVTELLSPGDAAILDMEYYLGRIDKLYVDSKGAFRFAKGTPSERPVAPGNPEDGMVMYTLTLPPYTVDAKDVTVSASDNRRYTMRDIGAIDKRVQKLEYYTLLTLLEKSTADMFIDDGEGNNRFKNGFVVDNFASHELGDIYDPQYAVTIDPVKREARPPMGLSHIELFHDVAESSNVVNTNGLLTLPYTVETYINQPLASGVENVTPYEVFSWIGRVQLSPASDTWTDTTSIPDLVVNDDSAVILAQKIKALDPGRVVRVPAPPGSDIPPTSDPTPVPLPPTLPVPTPTPPVTPAPIPPSGGNPTPSVPLPGEVNVGAPGNDAWIPTVSIGGGSAGGGTRYDRPLLTDRIQSDEF